MSLFKCFAVLSSCLLMGGRPFCVRSRLGNKHTLEASILFSEQNPAAFSNWQGVASPILIKGK